jgi:microcystin-dependent protein
MSQPYIGEIRMFAGSFAPLGWAFCDGSVLPISENEALFVLIGTTYGGDGQETFALPDLRGRVPVHQGTSPAGTPRIVGESAGVEAVTLTQAQLPPHSHHPAASTQPGTSDDPTGRVWAAAADGTTRLYATAAVDTAMGAGSVGSTGGSQPHDNLMPFLGVSFIISLFGIFPTQT